MSVKSKKNYSILVVMLVGVMLLGGVFAFFQYSNVGDERSQLLAGEVYLHYGDGGNVIHTKPNAFPETAEVARGTEENPRTDNVINFTIDGKNTTTNKDIYYEIKLLYGSDDSTKKRFGDQDLRFDLEETINGVTTRVLDNVSYDTINNKSIWVNTVKHGEAVEISYQLRMWIADDVLISDTDPNKTYTTGEYRNLFATVKVMVYGDFEEKKVQIPMNGVELIKSKIGTDGLVGINTNGAVAKAGDTIREYRYQGNGKYCTYTYNNVVYELNVETDYCPSATIYPANDSKIINYESDFCKGANVTCSNVVSPNESVPNQGDVNNYISFNNEMWRIIGVFETENADGETGWNIKIIRDKPLEDSILPITVVFGGLDANLKLDTSSRFADNYKPITGYMNFDYNHYSLTFPGEDYSQSMLMHYLNDENMVNGYYDKIDNNSKSNIETVKYYLGTIDYYHGTLDGSILYNEERNISCDNNLQQTTNLTDDVLVMPLGPEVTDDKVLVCNIWQGNNATWTGKIGLMYPSDFFYASVTNHSYVNWLNDNVRNAEYLISPISSYSYKVTALYSSGGFTDSFSSGSVLSATPVLYLKSNIIFKSGDGTYDKPYIIK